MDYIARFPQSLRGHRIYGPMMMMLNSSSTVCEYEPYLYVVLFVVLQGAVTPILAVGPSAAGVKMRSRGQRVFGTPVKGSMTNFKVGQMVKTTLHITGSVNGQRHFPDVIDSYCLFLSPFLQLHIITPSPQHYEHDEVCSNLVIIGASVSEPPLVDSTDALSR